jgi:hypothetical protein
MLKNSVSLAFIIRICHNAWSTECQICLYSFFSWQKREVKNSVKTLAVNESVNRYWVAQHSFNIVKNALVDHSLLKFIQSKVN